MKKLLPLIALIAGVLFVTFPLFALGFFVSDDGGWMIIRLSAFFQSFREGQFPVRFLGRLNFGYGYPVSNFLYPGFLYIGSLIHILGASFIDTVKILLGGSVLTGTLFTFLWLRKYFSRLASVTGALGFTFAPYLLFDLYRRGSVGELLALAVVSMGLYSIAAKKKWLLGLATALLILAHNSLALLFLGFFAVYITFLGVWRTFFLMFGTGIGMAAFFWFPALYEQKYVLFNLVTVADPRQFFITMGNGALLGVSGILAGVMSLFKKKLLKKEKLFFLITLILTIFFVLPVSSIFWQVPILARVIQFPYRLLSVTIFAGAWLTAYVIHSNQKLTQLLLVLVFVLLGLWGAMKAVRSVDYIHEPEGFYTTNEATTTVADEYMPKWVRKKPALHASDRLLFYQGRGTIEINKANSQEINVVVHAAEDSVIQVSTLYYPGWGATVDGAKARIEYSNDQGVMRIAVPTGRHHVVVAFRETISRFLADCVSLVSLIVFVVLLFL